MNFENLPTNLYGLHWYWDSPGIHAIHALLEDLHLEYYDYAQETYLCFMGEGFAKSYLIGDNLSQVLDSFLTEHQGPCTEQE
jgi:hypothetical protein